MRFVRSSCIALLVLVAMAGAAPPNLGAQDPKPQYKLDDAPALFEKYIKDYKKTYKDADDKKLHYEMFVKSLETINRLNKDPNQGSATFDLNNFADYTDEQRKNLFGLRKP